MKKRGGDRGSARTDEGAIDALFQLPPPEFVTARNALVDALKKSGQDDVARWVKSLTKPSTSVWAVNQLYWRHRAEFEKLLATGERFRLAQASRLAGGSTDIRSLLNERRDTLSEMARLAASILQKSSGASPPGVMRRVAASLEALSAYGTVPGAPRAGRLVADVDPPGFDTLAALVPRAGNGSKTDAPSKVLSFQKEALPAPTKKARGSDDPERQDKERQAKLAAAKAARQEATNALAEAKRDAEKAQATLKKAATRAKDTEKIMVATEARLQKTAEQAHEARQRARRAAVEAESAAQSVDEAERALALAKKEVAALES